MNQQIDQQKFEEAAAYHYRDSSLLITAITHSSYTNDRHMPKTACNERMEFLGDAVLELVCSEALFRMHTDMPEGELTRMRASIVCEPTLAFCARQFGLGEYLLLGRGEDGSGGRNRDSVLSDALEAVIGSIYLDGGIEAAAGFIKRVVLNDLEHKKLFFDSKTVLQEMAQKIFGSTIHYEQIGEDGPEHCKIYTARVLIGDKVMDSGSGSSKKSAEQAAAYQTILSLKKMGYERD